ncbi:MAG: hemolysin family protein [Clostridium sp.]|uniref:hemolysin family protein n=1 Tax=Clostridium culturomicium TaxID=1499683 RepID=UPI00059044AD|nr:hemolysin family protein [Clostridium culturomicium]MDU4890245.1 hemolysin family protein [Clostridium sp.]MDU7084313.1 hemolysin family protein [Clostridium sp.]
MDDSSGGSIILILILVMVNAFFASAEMAIVSMNKTKLNLLAEDNNKKAKLLLSLVKDTSKFLATIQVGITFAGFFASASAATTISSQFGEFLTNFGIPYGNNIALVITTLIISYITLVLGELVPKRIALQNAEKIAMISVKTIIIISKITKPFVWFLSLSTNLILKLLGVKTDGVEEKISREEIRSLVELGEEQGTINETERTMIDGIIKFDDILAKEVMTPRTETFCIEANTDIKESINLILQENYSRIPVYEEEIDNIVGVIYMKEIFAAVINNGIETLSIKDVMRTPYMVPETKSIDKLLKDMQDSQNHIAVVIDEYGGFSGIVTLEDLLEEVIGEIEDEYDDSFTDIEKIDDKTYIVNGLVTISDINKYLNLDFQSNAIDTIGGLVIENIGTIPNDYVNKEIIINCIKFKILSLDGKRIEKIQLSM